MESDYVNAECIVFWLGVSAFISLIRGIWFSWELIRYWFFLKVDNRYIVENRVVVPPRIEWSESTMFIIPAGSRFALEQSNMGVFRVVDNWHIVVMPSFGQPSSMSTLIGLVLEVFDEDDDLIMSVDLLIRVDLFFRFPMERAKRILMSYAEDDDETVLLANDFCVVLGLESGSVSDVYEMPFLHKTHWIRILQRKWKRIYAQRMERLRRRGSLSAQRRFELTGSYGAGLFERKEI